MNARGAAASGLCVCPVEGASRHVLLEIGDQGRIASVRCPNCELPVLDGDQIGWGLHAEDLLVTMTRITEPADGDDGEYVWYSLSEPPAELLAGGSS